MTKQELTELLKKARKQLKKYHVPKDEQVVTLSIDTLEKALSEQPTIVRCKDCKWFIKKFENEGRCIKHDNDYHDPDWFCADGEREEGR